jgi:hypothetical protein
MKKKLVGSIVSAAVLSGIATAASADAIISPFFDTRSGAVTFVSVVTKNPGGLDTGSTIMTRWAYLFKNSLTNKNEKCENNAGNGFQTVNDLTTFDLGSGSTVLESVDPDNDTGHFISSGLVGMFTIWNSSNMNENAIAGEVLFLTQGGLLGTYRMINDPNETAQDNFDDAGYGAFGSPVTVPPLLIWHPSNVLTTSWVVSVLDADMASVAPPNLAVRLQVADASFTNGFYYDRDENRNQTSKFVDLACIARIDLMDLIDVGGLASAQAEGGWAHLNIMDLDTEADGIQGVGTLDRSIIVGKIESQGPYSVYTSENRVDY